MFRHLPFIAALTLCAATATAQNASQIASVQSGQSCAGCNLFQADFSYRDLAALDLSGSRLRQADLSLSTMNGVNFEASDLSITNMFGARFTGANFRETNLHRAVMVGAYFGGVDFTSANLSGANLAGAELDMAHGLTQAQLNTACGDASTRLPTGMTIPAC